MRNLVAATQCLNYPNGLTLLLTSVPDSALVSINLCLGMGNLYEVPGERGISALMQEVMTKGTQRKNAEELAGYLESLGASFDASSGYFAGRLRIVGPAENIEDVLPVFLEIVTEPAFREEETLKEQQYLQNLIRSLDDDPLKAATIRFQKSFYGKHPFATTHLGEIEDLSCLTSDRLINWHQTIYQPSNMVISVAGNFPLGSVERMFETTIARMDSGPRPLPVTCTYDDSGQAYIERKSIRDCWIVYGQSAPSILMSRERAAFEILNTLLGGGLFSRLFLRIREERGLSYQVGSLYVPLPGPSFFCAFAGFPPDHLREVLDLLRREMKDLEQVNAEEYQEAKQYCLGNYLTQLEGVQSLTSLLAFYERIGLEWEHLLKYESILREIDHQEAAQQYHDYLGKGEAVGGICPRDCLVEEDIFFPGRS